MLEGWGPRPSPKGGGGGEEEEGKSPGQLVWSRTPQKTSSHPYSTLYVPGKHLLSSLAQKLASNLPPHSCLLTPITVYTAPLRSRDGEKKEGREGILGERWRMRGIEREGQGQIPESHKAKPEPLAKTNTKKKDRTLSPLICTSRDHRLVFS